MGSAILRVCKNSVGTRNLRNSVRGIDTKETLQMSEVSSTKTRVRGIVSILFSLSAMTKDPSTKSIGDMENVIRKNDENIEIESTQLLSSENFKKRLAEAIIDISSTVTTPEAALILKAIKALQLGNLISRDILMILAELLVAEPTRSTHSNANKKKKSETSKVFKIDDGMKYSGFKSIDAPVTSTYGSSVDLNTNNKARVTYTAGQLSYIKSKSVLEKYSRQGVYDAFPNIYEMYLFEGEEKDDRALLVESTVLAHRYGMCRWTVDEDLCYNYLLLLRCDRSLSLCTST